MLNGILLERMNVASYPSSHNRAMCRRTTKLLWIDLLSDQSYMPRLHCRAPDYLQQPLRAFE